MAAIEQWVEQGRKPTRIVASRVRDGKVERPPPLCPFGQVARWNGTGSNNDEASFACVADEVITTTRSACAAAHRKHRQLMETS